MFRLKYILTAFSLVTLAAIGMWVNYLLTQGGMFKEFAYHGYEACTPIEGMAGPEDIVIDHARGQAFVSAFDRRAFAAGDENARGEIYLLDLNNRAAAPVALSHAGADVFNPHGIDLWLGEDGTRRLMVVNHLDLSTHRIEIFDVAENGALTHMRSVADPAISSPNDVAATGPESFYATNDLGSETALGKLLEMTQLANRSTLAYYDGTAGKIVADGFLFANGVGVMPGTNTVVMTEFFGQSLWLYERDPATGELTGRDVIHLPTHLDNVNFDEEGGIWIGAQPNVFAFLKSMDDEAELSPSQILRVRLNQTGPGGHVDEVYMEDGTLMTAASAAAPYAGGSRMLLGNILENHILDCEVKEPAQ